MRLLLPLALLALGCRGPAPQTPTEAGFVLDAEALERLGAAARSAVEEELGLDLADYARFELATAEDVKAALDLELVRQFEIQFDDPEEAERTREQFVETLGAAMLAKFSYGERAILVVPETFDWMAELLDRPELRSEAATYAVLVHEAVHAAQDALYGWQACLDAIDDVDRLKSFNAVAEGHAQHVTRALCRTEPWSEGFEVFTESIGAVPLEATEVERMMARVASALLVTAYYDGERFIRAVEAEGGPAAVERAFREPPEDLDVIYNPEWFLEPGTRPEARFDLAAAFAPLLESFPEEDWNHQDVPIERPQLEASFSILPAAEVAPALDSVRGSLVHLVQRKEDLSSMFLPVLFEFDSPDDAAAFLALEERLMLEKDAVMAEGAIRIVSAEYTPIRDAVFSGLLAHKVVESMGQKFDVKAAVLVRGPLLVEATAQNLEIEDELLVEACKELLAAALGGNGSDGTR